MTPFISINVLTGIIAQWAVRQSPYPCPENLFIVLTCFYRDAEKFALPEFPDDWPCVSCTREDLMLVLDRCLFNQQLVEGWNQRKNGREGPQFVSLRPQDPDDDFIDLDALRKNIINDALKFEREEHAVCEAGFKRAKRRFMKQLRKIFRQ